MFTLSFLLALALLAIVATVASEGLPFGAKPTTGAFQRSELAASPTADRTVDRVATGWLWTEGAYVHGAQRRIKGRFAGPYAAAPGPSMAELLRAHGAPVWPSVGSPLQARHAMARVAMVPYLTASLARVRAELATSDDEHEVAAYTGEADALAEMIEERM